MSGPTKADLTAMVESTNAALQLQEAQLVDLANAENHPVYTNYGGVVLGGDNALLGDPEGDTFERGQVAVIDCVGGLLTTTDGRVWTFGQAAALVSRGRLPRKDNPRVRD